MQLTKNLFKVVDNLLDVDSVDLQMSQEESNTSARSVDMHEFGPLLHVAICSVFHTESSTLWKMWLSLFLSQKTRHWLSLN